MRFNHTFPCCIVVKDVRFFTQCRIFLPRISSSYTSGNRLASNNGSIWHQMKNGKFIYSFYIHVDLLAVRFDQTVLQRSATSCKVLQLGTGRHGLIYNRYYPIDRVAGWPGDRVAGWPGGMPGSVFRLFFFPLPLSPFR